LSMVEGRLAMENWNCELPAPGYKLSSDVQSAS
jgi:hypothetical protein